MTKKITETRIVVTGGGTGGHVYPLTAVIAALQEEGIKEGKAIRIDYVGSCLGYRGIIESNGAIMHEIAGSKLRRYASFANFIDIFKFGWSLIQAFWHLYWIMPDVVFSKGGTGSLPVVFAAEWYRIPLVIHESDTVPGLTNKVAAKYAEKIGISFPEAAEYFDAAKTVLVGNPIRTSLFHIQENETREHIKRFFNFDPSVPLILVLGGSQGAVTINNFITDLLPTLLPVTQIFHQTGKENYKTVVGEAAFVIEKLPKEIQSRYHAIDYFENDIRLAMKAADLIISRAGAGAIFEIAAFGKASILIPLENYIWNRYMK